MVIVSNIYEEVTVPLLQNPGSTDDPCGPVLLLLLLLLLFVMYKPQSRVE